MSRGLTTASVHRTYFHSLGIVSKSLLRVRHCLNLFHGHFVSLSIYPSMYTCFELSSELFFIFTRDRNAHLNIALRCVKLQNDLPQTSLQKGFERMRRSEVMLFSPLRDMTVTTSINFQGLGVQGMSGK